MPKRTDIESILLIGAGPIVIGQACEFDYSGTQACQALKEEGYKVILVNSNPATIMTDPDIADATYIEPIHWKTLASIIEKERPDAILPTMGGQTALNCALDLAREGILKKYNVEMIGATREAIDKGEDRDLFRKAMKKIGLDMPHSAIAHSLEDALAVLEEIGFPAIIRPSFTMGGSGGGIAYNREEFIEICTRGLDLSPTNELLIDESIIGWKEYEMEVVRDKNDNCIIVCSIENLDPMGIHTGDSITVAPAQTLTDKEYQIMRNAAIAVLREIGVETGGSNVQFAVNPKDGKLVIIEMNPRVSRSSALASKATGFPIAKVAAKLAVGYTLNELRNDVTGGIIPSSFEPSIDYIVTKIPRFDFEKFPGADKRLSTQMKSVGEVMAIGRTFKESLQKALSGLEIGVNGLNSILHCDVEEQNAILAKELREAGAKRIWFIADALRNGFSLEDVHRLTNIDPWFLNQLAELVVEEEKIKSLDKSVLSKEYLYDIKRQGFSDARLAELLASDEKTIRQLRLKHAIKPVYKRVDSCAAEFKSDTAYLYSTYEEECEAAPDNKQKIMILGGGPNRIGQGIEFDYCCVHAAMALREEGYEVIMVNCNPETVSTDYDVSDRLYFEPLTLEHVLNIVDIEKPHGVIVQYGGQTPLKLAKDLANAGVNIIGTSPDDIDRAEDRERFQQVVEKLKLKQPANATVRNLSEALEKSKQVGFPLVVRPSYVLGGRAMQIVHTEKELETYLQEAVHVSNDSPVLLDHYLEHAIEVDVDALSDGEDVLIGGILEHIEQAGVHSGDSACSLPAFSLRHEILNRLRQQMRQLVLEFNVVGLANAQFAVQDETIYILEVNPRASRTVPFVSKAIGSPLAKIAARCMVGIHLRDQGYFKEIVPEYYSIKQPVFPFNKFLGVDPVLGPEMKSTGEVMGIGYSFGEAYSKGLLGRNMTIKAGGLAFVSVYDADKHMITAVARDLIKLGFELCSTRGTAKVLRAAKIPCLVVNKVREGRPHIVDMIKNGEISFIVNTTEGKKSLTDSHTIRSGALHYKVPYNTTIAGAKAAILAMRSEPTEVVNRIQDLHAGL